MSPEQAPDRLARIGVGLPKSLAESAFGVSISPTFDRKDIRDSSSFGC
jgi:hypothetical protein